MSTHNSGFGAKAARSPEFESDFANTAHAPDNQSWGGGAGNAQKNEVPFMVQGAGRPGQPNMGQRSIFGNGGPSFSQMPAYTPVTRGPAQGQPAPQPQAAPQTAYPSEPAKPAQARPQAAPRPQAPAPSFQTQPQPSQGYASQQHYQPQTYGSPSSPYHEQDLPDLSNADPGFPDSIFGDFKADAGFPETDFADHGTADQSFADPSFGDQSFADQNFTDQSFTDQGDASFPETNFATDFGSDESMSPSEPGFGANEPRFEPLPQTPSIAQMRQPQAYQPQGPQAAKPQPQQGQVPPSDPRRQLQAFDAVYDQPPRIALGATQATQAKPAQDFFEADRTDADFLDESQVTPALSARAKLANSLKGRSAFMVGSALLGAIALGGALAFAYKQSGGATGETPIVTADARPVKEAPNEPGGKEFPHKNKLIYDRLTNGDEAESEQLVPRQEDVAVPALPPAGATAGLPAPVATTDMVNPATTQSVEGEGDGGPRKVKTMRVLPDGSVETAPAETADATQAGAAGAPAAGAPANGAAAGAPGAQAAAPSGGAMPVPAPEQPAPQAAPAAPAPAPQQVAAADPSPAAGPSKYVVQVGAHKSQTEALAIYADIQQKNPSLLGNYPPIVQKAAVSNGTMYRLRVGPMDSKGAADKLCGQLKAQGTDCFVVAQ